MRARAAWVVPIWTLFAFAGAAVLSSVGHDRPDSYDALYLTIALATATVGALVASRVPGNPIGWILCGISVYIGVIALAEGYVTRYLAGDGGAQGLAESAAWLSNWAWIPLVGVPLAFLPIYFPTGRPPSGSWRIVLWCAGIGLATSALSEAFKAGRLADYEQIVNPYGIDHPAVDVLGFGTLLVFAAIIGSVASVVVRFRRARGLERQQIKWLAYAASLAAGSLVGGAFISGSVSEDVGEAMILTGVASLPLAIGVAILKHRLYDIDVVVNRTLVYGALTATLAATYVGTVLLLQLLLSPGSDLAIAASTLAVAALFRPARGRIQALVDRRFYRRKYDAQRTLERFAARVRNQVDLDELSMELRHVVADTIQPAHVSLWVRRR